ncbi:tRNA (adenosine(37)-N6)-dimethylallyltransferase MiaA [Terasakiispira papahanaumokuakeensis]|uniref:tRNA dimethylallyltransferase n=1 Tax=Terasakiispira papahanaumokuakeensis TaxID=197479 RepID=A0A1E2V6E3_9GAMM|nr:tRNA (adenosine(37)-N6)-dimethylallyltransferase MiaA [Terasakiispira papahanaumokuakeensis]ODC02422.1 tRNA (adenosine(37)-N6)-dimethylallyltransferase MiaA [Terasakiispira papahanaumokuakeensis]
MTQTATAAFPPAIFLMGPTASGKTDLAMHLADHLPCELISVDSAQVYRGLDLGSAKPDAATLARYPHRLIDIRDPARPYSAADFRDDALRAMQEITAAGRIPLLVGGTMMYFQRLLAGEANLPEADATLRAELESQAMMSGWPALHQQLAEVDPESASRIAPNDSQRIQRALEIYQLTGRTRTELWAEQARQSFPYRTLQIGLAPMLRATLHQRIEQRFKAMLDQGFIEEVAALKQRHDLHTGLPSIRSVGYRQVWAYLEGEYDRETLYEKGIAATRQLAKRQITWMRRWRSLFWWPSDAEGSAERLLSACQPWLAGHEFEPWSGERPDKH